jgi:hypothetical protein
MEVDLELALAGYQERWWGAENVSIGLVSFFAGMGSKNALLFVSIQVMSSGCVVFHIGRDVPLS